MSTFVFKAMDLTGAKATGEVDADSKQVVADQLKARGLIVIEISAKHASKEIKLPFANRVKTSDLTIMTRQLATMVSSGMTILRALYVLESQTESDALSAIIVDVRKDVEAGLPLSDALERHPKVFSSIFVAMVRAGETGGVLEASLLRVADQLEKDEALRRQIKSAMVYPTVVLTFAVLVLLGLVTFIVPVFVGIFKQFGGKLPAMTQFTVAMSNLVKSYWWLLIVGFVGSMVGFKKWRRSKSGRPIWDAFRLRLPMKIGDIVQKVALARWSRTLSALTSAGVPLLAALDITSKTAGNYVVEKAMTDVIESVKRGGTIAAPLKDASVFPGMVTQMVAVGEETGAMDTMLSKVADFYEDEVDAAVKALTSILEPVMIVVIGGIVGFIVISMYLPLFKVYDQIK
ncbi:MAG: type pilus assembly protein PilC [Solirubrobacteraceae bacterium]